MLSYIKRHQLSSRLKGVILHSLLRMGLYR